MLREEAIKKHRAMWNWIAEEIEKEQDTLDIAFLKSIFLEQKGDDTVDMQVHENCYLCCYTTSECDKCPLLWPSESDILMCVYGYKSANGYSKGLYNKCYHLYHEDNWKLQAKLCRKIANLPQKAV